MKITNFKLEDLATISAGGTPKRSESTFWNGGEIPWVKIKDIKGKYVTETEEKITELGLEKSSAKIFPKGTILYTIFATLGECAILDIDATTNQAIAGIKVKSDQVLSDYLYYFLKSIKDKVINQGRGVAQNNINLKVLRNIIVPVPSIENQKNIIKILQVTESVIGRRQQQIEALSALKQSVFLDMFGDPYRNKNSFDILKLSDIKLDISNGLHLKRDEYDEDGNTAVIWISDFINKGKVDFEDIKKANVDYKRYERYKVSYGDVFFVRSSLTPEGIGKCGFIPNTNADKVIFEDHIIKVRLNNTILPEYFQAFSETTFFRNQIIKQSNTSTMTTINQNSLLDCKVMVAPIKEQQEFIEKVNQIEKNITELTESLSHFEVLYESLLHKAFNGELFKEEIKA